MALSAAAHHSFDKMAAGAKYDGLRAQKTDRAGEAANRAPRRQKSKAAGEAVFFELFDEDTVGVRPGVLAEPRPQEPVQRHTMEHIVDFVWCSPMVQILDAPVPQMVEQLPDVRRFFDRLSTVPEQAIEVPKILPEDVPCRTVLRDPQLAEQLVEVPTIVSYSSLQRNTEQNVDIPVPGRGGRVSGLQGFLPGHCSTAQRRVLQRNAFLSGLWSRSLLSNRQGLVFTRSCLLVPFFGISWVGAQTFPVPALGHQRMDITRVRALAGPSIDGRTQAYSDLQGIPVLVVPTFWRRRPLPSHSCGLHNYGY